MALTLVIGEMYKMNSNFSRFLTKDTITTVKKEISLTEFRVYNLS